MPRSHLETSNTSCRFRAGTLVSVLPSTGELASMPMLQKNQVGLLLKVFTGHNRYVTRPTENEIVMVVGALVCGFGKAVFKQNVDGKIATDASSEFNLKCSEDLVLYNNALRTLASVIGEKRSEDPNINMA